MAVDDVYKPGTRFRYTETTGAVLTGTIISYKRPSTRGVGHVYGLMVDGWPGYYTDVEFCISLETENRFTWL